MNSFFSINQNSNKQVQAMASKAVADALDALGLKGDVASNISLVTSGFSKNLDATINNVQKMATRVDQLPVETDLGTNLVLLYQISKL